MTLVKDDELSDDPIPYVLAEPTGADLLCEVRAARAEAAERGAEVLAEVRAARAEIAELAAKFDQAAEQIGTVADLAGPAIEQLTASPIMKMLTGGGKRGPR